MGAEVSSQLRSVTLTSAVIRPMNITRVTSRMIGVGFTERERRPEIISHFTYNYFVSTGTLDILT